MLAQFLSLSELGDFSYMDIIFINQLELETIIGIHDWERKNKQPVILDIEIGCSIKQAVKSDRIEDCVDYFSVCERMKKLADRVDSVDSTSSLLGIEGLAAAAYFSVFGEMIKLKNRPNF